MKNNIKNKDGFSLIEMALVLIVSGFVGLTIASSLKYFLKNQELQKTKENAEIIKTALFQYYRERGVYPCPADPTLSANDPNYGVSQCRNFADIAFDTESCAGTPGGLSCTTSFSRDVDNSSNGDVVMIGVIPFSTIFNQVGDRSKFRWSVRQDGYGSLYSYAVTESMTNTAIHGPLNPANPETGAIRIIDENDVNLTTPPDSAHYAFISHGPNRMGAYSIDGKQGFDCNLTVIDMITGNPVTPPPGSSVGGGALPIDFENCDNTDAIFVQGIRSSAQNSNYYDDLLYYESIGFDNLWEISPFSTNSQRVINNTNLGDVGIGTRNPAERLHLRGDMKVETSTASSRYCQGTDSVDCLDLEVLLDTDPSTGNVCPDGKAAYAIGNNKIKCKTVNWVIPTKTCAPISGVPTFLRGISNAGNIYCCTKTGNVCAQQ